MKANVRFIVIGVNIIVTIVVSFFILFKADNRGEVDLFFTATTFMTFLLTTFNSVIPSVFLPFFNLGAGKKELANIVLVFTICLIVPIIILNLLSNTFGELIFPNFYFPNKNLFNYILRISNFTFYFTTVSLLFNCYFISRNKILLYEKCILFTGIPLVAILFFVKKDFLHWYCLINLIRWAIVFVYFLYIVKFKNINFNLLKIKKDINQIKNNFFKMVIANGVYKTEVLVDRFFFSNTNIILPPGSIAVYAYAVQIIQMISTFLSTTFITSKTRNIFKLFGKGADGKLLNKSIKSLMFKITFPILISIIFLILIQFLLKADILNKLKFDFDKFVLLYLVGLGMLVFGVTGAFVSSICYNLGLHTSIVKSSVITYGIFLIFKYFLYLNFNIYSFMGLTSLYYFSQFALNFNILKKHLQRV